VTRPTVFYAVASMGMGHAVRAEPVLRWLAERAELHVFAGGPARGFLAERLPALRISEIHRPRYAFDLRLLHQTPRHRDAARTAPRFARSFVAIAAAMTREQPAVLVSDFEPLSVYAALALRPHRKVPIVALSDMAAFWFGRPAGVRRGEGGRLAVIRAQWRSVVPHAERHLVTHFVPPPLPLPADGPARWAPPPVRAEIEALRSCVRRDGPAVVYLGQRDVDALHPELAGCGLPLLVYGAAADGERDGVRYRRFDQCGYLDDLRRAPFLLSSGGHSSIVDALALGKPVAVLPAPGHFEQELNARAVAAAGVGAHLGGLGDGELARFAAAPPPRPAIDALGLPDNDGFFAAFDRALAEVGVPLTDRAPVSRQAIR
jgi:uncharacterized protein (TIGR00661 family)